MIESWLQDNGFFNPESWFTLGIMIVVFSVTFYVIRK